MGASMKTEAISKGNQEGSSLVWLDAHVNQNEKYMEAQRRLRASNLHLRTYQDEKCCEVFLRSVSSKNAILLIVSGQLGEGIVPRIHSMAQISAIYVYCQNRNRSERWTTKYKKV
jgi:hypothetical protein